MTARWTTAAMRTSRIPFWLMVAFCTLWFAAFYWISTSAIDQNYGCSLCLDEPYCRGGIPAWWTADGVFDPTPGRLAPVDAGLSQFRIEYWPLTIAIAAAAVPVLLLAGVVGLVALCRFGWHANRFWRIPAGWTALAVVALTTVMVFTVGPGWLGLPTDDLLVEGPGIAGLGGLLVFGSALSGLFYGDHLKNWWQRRQERQATLKNHDWAHDTTGGWDEKADIKPPQ